MTATIDTAQMWRVSNREVKEETYRALRAKGYDWGRAGAAGRITDLLQVIWGEGLSAIVPVLRRAPWQARAVQVRGQAPTLHVDAKGLGVALAGPSIVALALGSPGATISVSGLPCGPALAAAVWDLGLEPATPVWWGVERGGQIDGYLVDSSGALHQVGAGCGQGSRRHTRRFSVGTGEQPTSAVVVGADRLRHKISEALRTGVAVTPNQWRALMAIAGKFLVPER